MDDLISRQAAIDAVNEALKRVFVDNGEKSIGEKIIGELQPAQRTDGDTVSRQAAIDAVEKESQIDGAYGYMDTKSIVDLLSDLPSAQPERKKISEEKMKIVIENYFKDECDVNTSIKSAFEKGFRTGVKKGMEL